MLLGVREPGGRLPGLIAWILRLVVVLADREGEAAASQTMIHLNHFQTTTKTMREVQMSLVVLYRPLDCPSSPNVYHDPLPPLPSPSGAVAAHG